MMTKIIYLDYAATTPVEREVASKMFQYLEINGHFGNAGSNHAYGEDAKKAVEQARFEVASFINALPHEIIWTSGATEANNLAIKGALFNLKNKHIITSAMEHASVLQCLHYLEKKGVTVTYLAPNQDGLITLEAIQSMVRDNTALISIAHVNNEIGVIQNIKEIAEWTALRGILLHVDAAQSIGKIPLDMKAIPLDLMSFSAHKIYGPKGIGALFVRSQPKVKLIPQMQGGGQEFGIRSGTLPVHQIVGFGEAIRIANACYHQDYQKIVSLRNYFLENMQHMNVVIVNGSLVHTYPGILNLQFTSDALYAAFIALKAFAISQGAACHAETFGSSHVLRALGLNSGEARRSIRLSFGRFTEKEDITSLLNAMRQISALKVLPKMAVTK